MSVSKDQLIDFIYEETRMLDEGRYTEWLALWLADGHYWIRWITSKAIRSTRRRCSMKICSC